MPLAQTSSDQCAAQTVRRADSGVRVETVRTRLLAAALCSILVAVPFLSVRFPPITDLPQHVAQIRLFVAALGDVDSGYRIQWFTPYSAAYALIGAAWALSAPDNAGRLAVLGLAMLWTIAVHALAGFRRRPVAAAVLATVLAFNHTLYWGFLSFAIGSVAFMLWFVVTTRAPADRVSVTAVLLQFGCGLLLYVSHVLWFAFAVVWLLAHAALHRWPLRATLWRLGSVAPVIAGAALWYPHLEALGFVSPTVWFTPPPQRVSPAWMVDSALGGLNGATEWFVAAILAAWLLGGLWQQRARDAIDWDLLGTGVLLVLLGLTMPDQHMNTIQFAARWVPLGVVCLILAAPAPLWLSSLQRPLALAVVAVFSFATTLAWMTFERVELSGLAEALAAIPADQRVVGLDLVQESRIVKGRPFLQTFAYAQVLHGGRLNASFAGFAPSLVVYRERRTAPWTANLEWFAERVQREDLRYFDYALINGTAAIHAQAAALPLAPVTGDGRWRLYRVTAP
jgi:hypothetical protein